MRTPKNTSWDKVAQWYDEHLGQAGKDTYHSEVVIPAVLMLLKQHVMETKKGRQLLDLACGQGIFSRVAAAEGYNVTGIDLAPQLIKSAQQRSKDITYHVSDARKFPVIKPNSQNVVVCILALQNIDDISKVFKEVYRVLKSGGVFIFVINHPVLRIPKQTSWGWDAENKIQYRRLDSYLTESEIPITTHPGQKDSEITMSYHRPLQSYAKALGQSKLAIIDIAEMVSHKVSEPGPKAKAENTAREEFPMFMAVVAEK